ncbi:MAG: oligopeptide/dipeptide ABC transporter ATP-binding protein [Candidatus Hydrogenedentes bacterium]|nr:oligopeptide/dipeptide ABC transporter ATP-binding protein [Candidatus Hydrogenedentota bacterium]
MNQRLLEIQGLTRFFPIKTGLFRKQVGEIRAVDDVSFHINQGETLGLVGESGCGKTTTGRMILRLLERTSGTMYFHLDGQRIDLSTLQGERLRQFRRHMQMIFQDPFSSLNPRMTVLDIIGEPLKALNYGSKSEIEDRVRWVTKAAGLQVEFLRRYPHAFSGGQRQRIGIARALVLNPKLIVCDEPVSALDVSVQAQIINLLKDLQEEFGLTYLFIAHDLSVVENISSRVAVMYCGRIVELSETNELFQHPRHPYTEALMSAVPKPEPDHAEKRTLLKGEVADPSNLPPGCAFHPRCRYAQNICKQKRPELKDIGGGHYAACHFARELELEGVESAMTSS